LKVDLGRLDARSLGSSPSPLSQAKVYGPQSAAAGSAVSKKKNGNLQIQPKGMVDGAVKIDLGFLEVRKYTDGIDAQVDRLRARARRTAAEEAVTGGLAKKKASGVMVSILKENVIICFYIETEPSHENIQLFPSRRGRPPL